MRSFLFSDITQQTVVIMSRNIPEERISQGMMVFTAMWHISQTVTDIIMNKLRTFTGLVTNKLGTPSLVDIMVWKYFDITYLLHGAESFLRS